MKGFRAEVLAGLKANGKTPGCSGSVQSELFVHIAPFGGLDEPLMGHADRMQRSIQAGPPEIQKASQLRIMGVQVIALPDEALEQARVVGQVVEDVCGRQAIALQLCAEVGGRYGIASKSVRHRRMIRAEAKSAIATLGKDYIDSLI